MKTIFGYLREYFYVTDKKVLTIVSLLAGTLIFLNYHFLADDHISKDYSFAASFGTRYIIFLLAFGLPYFFYTVFKKRVYIRQVPFLILLFSAPAIFSLKMALDIPIHFSDRSNWNNYWNHIFYWPVLLFITGTLLFVYWRVFDREQPFYGLKTAGINWRPYLLMLLIMVPLVASASTQADFLEVYPKLKSIESIYNEPGITWWHKLLFELSYGSDFVSIELFFRGFLVLGFIKWAGKDAILPMACFYCTIHFGKPLGECISSYFGGILLGVVVYQTRSILGGLVVHLGIAWMMEIGGYIGNAIN
ncbi:MAG: CPBP family intramembrane glutamic endopeptidase [Chitinophagaceae bacterium]